MFCMTKRMLIPMCHDNLDEEIKRFKLLGDKHAPKWIESLDELLDLKDEKSWFKIAAGFRKDFQRFDRLILKIHYIRNKPLGRDQLYNILYFLTIGYINSNDIRYYNEFLWFRKNTFDELYFVNKRYFKENLGNGLVHKYPLNINEDISNIGNMHHKNKKGINCENPNLKVATLGPFQLFKSVISDLQKQGFAIKCFHFPDSIKGWKRFIVGNSIIAKTVNCICYNKTTYKTIEGNHTDQSVKSLLKDCNCDIAIQRMGLIIRENLINSFKYGILNDHWGLLPYFRGYSTPEYSVLHAVPIFSTIHFIDVGIDTGKIIDFYRIDSRKFKNIDHVKRYLRKTKNDRFCSTLQLIATQLENTNSIEFQDNSAEAGLQYFKMHPSLVSHVNKILEINHNVK